MTLSRTSLLVTGEGWSSADEGIKPLLRRRRTQAVIFSNGSCEVGSVSRHRVDFPGSEQQHCQPGRVYNSTWDDRSERTPPYGQTGPCYGLRQAFRGPGVGGYVYWLISSMWRGGEHIHNYSS